MFYFLDKDTCACDRTQEPKDIVYIQNLAYHNLY